MPKTVRKMLDRAADTLIRVASIASLIGLLNLRKTIEGVASVEK